MKLQECSTREIDSVTGAAVLSSNEESAAEKCESSAEEYCFILKDYYDDLVQFPELYEEELVDADVLVERLRCLYACAD